MSGGGTYPASSGHGPPNQAGSLSRQAGSQGRQPPSWFLQKAEIEEVNRLASCLLRMVPSFTSALRRDTSCMPSHAGVPGPLSANHPQQSVWYPRIGRTGDVALTTGPKAQAPALSFPPPQEAAGHGRSPRAAVSRSLALPLPSEGNPGAEDCFFLPCVCSVAPENSSHCWRLSFP